MLKTGSLTAAIVAVFLLISVGCNLKSTHPNQINAFDGTSFDSLTAAHAALSALRTPVAKNHPQYTGTFNLAAASYLTAYEAYALFRAQPANQEQTALALSNLAVSIVALENAFQSDMQVTPHTVGRIRSAAVRQREAINSRITISDVLTELEIAAAIASSVPGTQPYSLIAEVVIKATQAAVTALSNSSGQPIELSAIEPVPPIQ